MNQRFKTEKIESMEEFYNILKVGKPGKIHDTGPLKPHRKDWKVWLLKHENCVLTKTPLTK